MAECQLFSGGIEEKALINYHHWGLEYQGVCLNTKRHYQEKEETAYIDRRHSRREQKKGSVRLVAFVEGDVTATPRKKLVARREWSSIYMISEPQASFRWQESETHTAINYFQSEIIHKPHFWKTVE